MSTTFRAACVQINAERDIAPNIETASELIRLAHNAGAELILTPENVAMLEPKNKLLREKALSEADHPALAAFRELAAELKVWLVIGSLAIRLEGGKIANRSFLVNDTGEITARYDKIHMFDVDLGNGESYRESETFEPGAEAVIAETPWGKLGMTVCYDLRFPYLYRDLAKRGASFLAVPAAFTRVTGRAHWHVLQRARAIENGCFVFAPGQCGEHAERRETFGHSLIIDPWGEVLGDAGDQPGFVVADIDVAKVEEVRGKIPSLTHDREYG